MYPGWGHRKVFSLGWCNSTLQHAGLLFLMQRFLVSLKDALVSFLFVTCNHSHAMLWHAVHANMFTCHAKTCNHSIMLVYFWIISLFKRIYNMQASRRKKFSCHMRQLGRATCSDMQNSMRMHRIRHSLTFKACLLMQMLFHATLIYSYTNAHLESSSYNWHAQIITSIPMQFSNQHQNIHPTKNTMQTKSKQ